MNLNETQPEINTTTLAQDIDKAQVNIDQMFNESLARINAQFTKMQDDLDKLVRRLHESINRHVQHDGLCDRCDAFAGDCLVVDRPNPTSYRTTDTVCGPCRKGAQ